jgi:predicted RecB family endonuclease
MPHLLLLLLLLLQVQAERTAWQLAEELGLDVVTILPNFVLVRLLGLFGVHCRRLSAMHQQLWVVFTLW